MSPRSSLRKDQWVGWYEVRGLVHPKDPGSFQKVKGVRHFRVSADSRRHDTDKGFGPGDTLREGTKRKVAFADVEKTRNGGGPGRIKEVV